MYMKVLLKQRKEKGVSQRSLSALANVSFRTVQLIESGDHDAKISTLKRIATSLGYPPEVIDNALQNIFSQPPDSIAMISERIFKEGEASWKTWLFNFVDAFRVRKDISYVNAPPLQSLSERTKALLASTVEVLCEELDLETPTWCSAIPSLKEPWFVSGVENLKAAALLESPIHFKKRNIFVLENFLSRR